jgi:hypothetical protein
MKIREKLFIFTIIFLVSSSIVISFRDSMKGEMKNIGKINKLHIFDNPETPYVPPPYPESGKLYIIDILPFEPRDGFTQAEADSVSSLFARYLSAVWGIMLLEHNTIDETSNVNCVISGSLSKLSDQILISIKMFEPNGNEELTGQLIVDSLIGLLTPIQAYVEELVPSLPGSHGYYAIGDTGPGGGTVFYSFYGHYMEAKSEIGLYSWDNALTLAKNNRAGGFSDWLIPTAYELNMIYQNLKKNNLGSFIDDYYWSSSLAHDYGYNFAWEQNFGNGLKDYFASYTRVSHVILFRRFTLEL